MGAFGDVWQVMKIYWSLLLGNVLEWHLGLLASYEHFPSLEMLIPYKIVAPIHQTSTSKIHHSDPSNVV